ncbi:MAG: four helix bundle protein [Methylobacteriaceae bacterium]|nr:four helix bundle protein [Methylobacteriaceae bacterium]
MGEEIKSHQDLRVWKEAMSLAEQSYTMTRGFPRDEVFGMTAQIRRSAASIPANIAEGYGRDSVGSYVQFLRTAQGSLKELETHVILASRVGLVAGEHTSGVLSKAEIVGKMLRSLIRVLQGSGAENPRNANASHRAEVATAEALLPTAANQYSEN